MKNIILTLLIFSKITFSSENVIEMSVNVIDSYERPTAVTAFLCWDIRKKNAFMRHLENSKRPHTINFVTGLKTVKNDSAKDVLFVGDLSCPGINEFLIKANSSNMFSSPHRWLLLDTDAQENNVVPVQLEALHVPVSSEVIVAHGRENGLFDIYLIYKLLRIELWLTEYYGFWSNATGFKKSNLMFTATVSRRRDLKGEILTVTFNVNDNHMGTLSSAYDNEIRNSFNSATKWGYNMVVPLFDFINATRLNVFSDGWGYFINGSWNGMVGDIVRGEADLIGTAIFMAKNRMPVLAYLMDPVQTTIVFVFREPPLSYQYNLFLLPFNRAVWLSLGALLASMLIAIYLNALWENKIFVMLENTGEEDSPRHSKLNLSDAVMMVVGAVTQQGSFVELRGSMGRVVMFILFLVFLFFFAAYSASIVALLQSSSKQIRTLSDLLNSKLELGVENTTYNKYYFTTATEPVRKAIYETKVAPPGRTPNFLSLEDGVKKLQKHPFAFHMDAGVGYRFVEKFFFEHEKCGLQEIAYIPRSKPWLTCKKTSPYTELLKIGFLRTREHGMSARANGLVYAKKPVCAVSGGSFDSVSIVDVYPALLMLLYGMLLAWALLAAEILVHRRLHTRHNDGSVA